MATKGIAQAWQTLIQFLSEVRAELAKVIWPSYDEFVGSTLVVLFLVAVFAVFFFFVDSAFAWLASYVIGIYGGY